MAQRVKFGDVRSESIQETGQPLGSYMGTSSREDPRNKSYRAENSQTKKEQKSSVEDSRYNDRSQSSSGDYERMTGQEANELFFQWD